MNASPMAMRIRSPLSSPRASPRLSARLGVRRGIFGPSWMVRWLLPCGLPLLIVSQWVTQLKSPQSSLNSGRLWMFYSNYSSADDSDDEARWDFFRSPLRTPNNADPSRRERQEAEHSFLPLSFFTFPKSSRHPLPVAWLAARRVNDTSTTYLNDVLDRSKYINMVQRIEYEVESRIWSVETLEEAPGPVVHVVDWASLERDCHVLERLFSAPSSFDDTSLSIMPSNNSHLLYHDTTNSARIVRCPRVDQLFASEHVLYAKQSIVQDRYWNTTLQWIEPGSILPELAQGNESGQSLAIRHAPRTLSQDFVNRLDKIREHKFANATASVFDTHITLSTNETSGTATIDGSKEIAAYDVMCASKSLDIAVLAQNGSHASYTFFRSFLTNQLLKHVRHRRYSIEMLGDPLDVLTNKTKIGQLLDAKIVVMAQPDEWQETTGLLEAMASGALVLTDAILQPVNGSLVDKISIVVYDSAKSLLQSLDYYLEHDNERQAIARTAYEYSRGYQRPWQGMERLLFGFAATYAGDPWHESPARRHGRRWE